ncbi:MAG: MATE family efflux transporter [Vicinamibacteria bacterium]|nr:MATE family efflux transporter [Vicinamibacteria bacterium]
MNDMTKGPVSGHVVRLAGFIAMSTAFQTLYFLADLYFVGKLGKEAVAGVSLAGTVMFLVLALTQTLGVGATSLVAQALGRKDRDQAERIFNQSLVLSNVTGFIFGVVFFSLRNAYCERLAADAATAAQGEQYLNWFIPALFLQFPLVAMGAALRGMGDMKIPTLIQIGTLVINILLAPTLMFGWITGHPLGVAGTAIASLIAVGLGCIALTLYFGRATSPIKFRRDQWEPEPRVWFDMLKIGVPAGGEFALMSVYVMLVYDIIRPFGSAAQAGFGIGARLMQSLFLPTVAIAFATGPVVGQNFGAKLGDRVRGAFRAGAAMSSVVMVILTALCHIAPEALLRVFNSDPKVVAFGSEYLRITSWNFLFSGLVFVSSSVFQGMGNTLPSLATSALRLVIFAVPAYVMAQRPGFQLFHVWQVGVAAVTLQFLVNMTLLRREFKRRLNFAETATTTPPILAEA